MYSLWGGRPNLFFGHACWLMSGYINSAFWFQDLLKKRDGILNLGWHYIQRGRSRKLRRMWHPGTQEGKDQDVRVLFCLGEESMEATWRYEDHHLWWNESMENSIEALWSTSLNREVFITIWVLTLPLTFHLEFLIWVVGLSCENCSLGCLLRAGFIFI